MRLIATPALRGLLVALAACGDDGGGMTVADAAVTVDASTNKVVEIACPVSPAATVMTVNTTDAYMPMATTVSVGAIVKFQMSTFHDAAPNPITTSDPGLVVGFGATKCLKFNAAGTFGFFCSAHSFAGTITVN